MDEKIVKLIGMLEQRGFEEFKLLCRAHELTEQSCILGRMEVLADVIRYCNETYG